MEEIYLAYLFVQDDSFLTGMYVCVYNVNPPPPYPNRAHNFVKKHIHRPNKKPYKHSIVWYSTICKTTKKVS